MQHSVVLKYTDDSITVVLIFDHADFVNYKTAISEIQQLCKANDL